jgi:hypothetical protein
MKNHGMEKSMKKHGKPCKTHENPTYMISQPGSKYLTPETIRLHHVLFVQVSAPEILRLLASRCLA